jgi:hypothetical protein
MHGPINVKSPNNISKWQMGFNSAFKGLRSCGKGKFSRLPEKTEREVSSSGSRDKKSQRPSLTGGQNFKNRNNLFNYIWPNNLKFHERRK